MEQASRRVHYTVHSGIAIDTKESVEALTHEIIEASYKNKPVVHICNTLSTKGSHWYTIILLPKGFRPYFAEPLFRIPDFPELVLIDSYAAPAKMAELQQRILPLYQSLVSFSNYRTESAFLHLNNSKLEMLLHANCFPLSQQKDTETCGYWSVINALYPLLYGRMYKPSPKEPLNSSFSQAQPDGDEDISKNEALKRAYPYDYCVDQFGSSSSNE